MPAALGAKLAMPERTVIACVGDGSYLFANPVASHQTAFFFKGKLIEAGPTMKIFTSPSEKQTEDYITGRFG